MTSEAEMLPCPFCGGAGEMSYYARPESPEPAGYFIECRTCSASGESVEIQGEAPDRAEHTQAAAITAWNTLATPPVQGEAVAWEIWDADGQWVPFQPANDKQKDPAAWARHGWKVRCLYTAPPPVMPDAGMREGGWIEWSGGAGPPPFGAVEIKLRSGDCYTGSDLTDQDCWRHIWGEGDIIAYRLSALRSGEGV